ncbi:MAG: hypothetical protein LBM09_00150 [Candidatus Nomurabacteria bacterium]|nr:hypothetical protein [Candidatus Nomurabacteria bacterium]
MKIKKILGLTLALGVALIVGFKADPANAIDATVGNADDFMNAIAEADAGPDDDTITLSNDIALTGSDYITIMSEYSLTIDLNGYTLTKPDKFFSIDGGHLVLTGRGSLVETAPDDSVIQLKGSDSSEAQNYSSLVVDDGVTLQGWAGVKVSSKTDPSCSGDHCGVAYGVNITINGTIIGLNDQEGNTGAGVYTNGTIHNIENPITIAIGETANISATGVPIFAEGYADWTIDSGAIITGVESAIGMKAGKWTINGGTFKATGPKAGSVCSLTGIEATGAAIQVESDMPAYTGNIDLTISGGTFTSDNGYAIFGYGCEGTAMTNVLISGGTFTSAKGLDAIVTTEDFLEQFSEGFITGGTFSSDVSKFIKATPIDSDVKTEGGELLLVKSTVLSENLRSLVPVWFADIEDSAILITANGHGTGTVNLANLEAGKKYYAYHYDDEGYVTLLKEFIADAEGNYELKDVKFSGIVISTTKLNLASDPILDAPATGLFGSMAVESKILISAIIALGAIIGAVVLVRKKTAKRM